MKFDSVVDFLISEKNKNYKYVKEHFGGNGFGACTPEELRDYYMALGRADMCSEILKMIRHVPNETKANIKESRIKPKYDIEFYKDFLKAKENHLVWNFL